MTPTSVNGISRAFALGMSLVILTSCSSESKFDPRISETELQISETESSTETQGTKAVLDTEDNLFEGRGKVVRLIANGSFIEIDHEDIVGYMAAMSMMFPVADTSMIHGITPDDSVHFQISGRGEVLLISRIAD